MQEGKTHIVKRIPDANTMITNERRTVQQNDNSLYCTFRILIYVVYFLFFKMLTSAPLKNRYVTGMLRVLTPRARFCVLVTRDTLEMVRYAEV